MPQGVEHYFCLAQTRGIPAVKLSLMPQGVEHAYYAGWNKGNNTVKLSLMPQGVEHKSNGCGSVRTCSSETIFDAARR